MDGRRRRTFAGLALAGVVAAGAAVPAAAEGQWESSITGALTGFNSRDWTDRNSDSVSTTVRFERCRDRNVAPTFTNNTVEVQLTRRTGPLQPDVNVGRQTLACQTAGTGDWGRVQAATYRFAITQINGRTSGGQVDVARVLVRY